MKGDAFNLRVVTLLIDVKSFEQVPGNCFALAVEVSGQNQFIALGHFFLQQVNVLLTLSQYLIVRYKTVFGVH